MATGYQLHAHSFRESVIRHERAQAHARFLIASVDPERAKLFLEETRKDWSSRRSNDTLFGLLSFVPGFGVAMFPVLGTAGFRALARHVENEKKLPGSKKLGDHAS
jgi:hypothetical protein